jgi:hypothetical protein
MIEWGKVAEIAGGGYGMTFFVLIALFLISWIIGLILQKVARGKKEGDTEKR